MQVIAALRHCFQHDTVEFLDKARFSRLLPLLVSQLGGARSPDGISAAEADAQDCGRDAAEGVRTAGAAVEALIKMVSGVKDQALWQMFNRQVRPCITFLLPGSTQCLLHLVVHPPSQLWMPMVLVRSWKHQSPAPACCQVDHLKCYSS